ncbi:integrase/recombinase xerD homolog isoform X1 [Crassostrea virginica]
MPPKRKIVSSGRSAKKRRVTATAPTEPDVVTTTSTTVSQGPAIASQSLPIDYDLLAAAIIRQSQPPQEQPLNCPASTSPQMQTCPSSSQPTEQHHNNYAPSQPEVIQPANPSGIGALLDQVFLGRLQSGSSLKSKTNGDPGGTVENLSTVCHHLLSSALSQSSVNAYRHAWDLFRDWKPTLSLPVSVVDVCNFTGHLFLKNYSASSIASHLSAISYVHKVLDLQDPTQAFITKKILRGCQSLGPTRDTRLPITPHILRRLLDALVHTVPQYSLRILLRALFLLAFHAFLRLGEVAVKSSQKSHLVLQRQDVTFDYNGPQLAAVQIIMRKHKTNKDHSPLVISLQSIPNSPYCPVNALFEYLNSAKHTSGPLFQTVDALPISYSKVSAHLKSTVQFIGLDPDNFKGHSFRIGAATYAASLGFSDNLIQKLGRWNSDAFRRYIRINSFRL